MLSRLHHHHHHLQKRNNRHKPHKSGERLDFKFSHLQLLQVPRGWDKLFVSISSVENGKTIAKTSKSLVQNGCCQWTESLSESIWVSQDDASKQLEECLFKLVVAMGSARSGILGEAIVNLTDYMSSKVFVPVSLPLKKCNYGTTLQVKIQCLTTRTQFRETIQWKGRASDADEPNMEFDDMDKSDGSGSMFQSVLSSPSNNLGGTSRMGEFGARDSFFSATRSRHSSDLGEGSIGRENSSPGNNCSNGEFTSNPTRQQDSCSLNVELVDAGLGSDPSWSVHSSFDSRGKRSGADLLHSQWPEVMDQSSLHVLSPIPLRTEDSSKSLLEAAEDTVDEVREEARMWERNAQKLKLDLELLRTEFSEQSRYQANLDMEISTAYGERDSLKLEIEQLKSMLDEYAAKQATADNTIFRAQDTAHLLNELQEEVQFQKESNANLSLQLNKTLESNTELVFALQELEETIESQKIEIGMLSAQKTDLEGSVEEKTRNLLESTEKEEIRSLRLQLQELQESQKHIQSLEESLEDSKREFELERQLINQNALDVVAEWALKLAAKEEEIIKLEAKVSDLLNDYNSEAIASLSASDSKLLKDIELLTSKVEELERDCNELTDENLDLIFRINELKKGTENNLNIGATRENSVGLSCFFVSEQLPIYTSNSDILKIKSYTPEVKQKLEKNVFLSDGVVSYHSENSQLIQLQNKNIDSELGLQSFIDKACNPGDEIAKDQLSIEDKETEFLMANQLIETHQAQENDRDNYHDFSLHSKTKNFGSDILKEMSKVISNLNMQLQVAFRHVNGSWHAGSTDWSLNKNLESEHGIGLSTGDDTDADTLKEQSDSLVSFFLELNNLLEAKIIECRAMFQHSALEIRERDLVVAESKRHLRDYILEKHNLYKSIEVLENLKVELQSEIAYLTKEQAEYRSKIGELEDALSLMKQETGVMKISKEELESLVSKLQNEKELLEGNLENALKESSITSKCLDDVRQELRVLTSSMDSSFSVRKTLESKLMEVGSEKIELEAHLSELKEENVQLLERISGLEAQLRYLTEDRESCRMELENSKFHVEDLENEISRLEIQIETEKVDLKQRLQETQQRWLKIQEEAEFQKRDSLKLQSKVDTLIKERNSHQKMNEELKRQGLELHEHCAYLEDKLEESQKKFFDCLKKVEILEVKLFSMQKEVASREKTLASEIEALLLESREDEKESGKKVQGLVDMVAAAKQNEEQLIADRDHVQRLLESVKDREENLKSMVYELESKLRASENERKQLEEEIDGLDLQLQRIGHLQGEILVLQSSLDEMRFEKCRLESSLESVYEECEELKMERKKFLDKISGMQKVLAEGEEARRGRVALEEKLMRFECDLTAREALCAHEAEIKNELGRYKRENSQYQRIIQGLEEEKEECLKRAHNLEAELKLVKSEDTSGDGKTVLSESSNKGTLGFSVCEAEVNVLHEKLRALENELERTTNQYREKDRQLCVKIDQLEKISKDQADFDPHQSKDHDKLNNHEERSIGSIGDLIGKIQLLETQLSEALEANNMYKLQLKSLLLEGQDAESGSVKEGYNHMALLLEAELKDIRERYSHMSLRFVQVEAQRQELAVKVKALQTGRRLLS